MLRRRMMGSGGTLKIGLALSNFTLYPASSQVSITNENNSIKWQLSGSGWDVWSAVIFNEKINFSKYKKIKFTTQWNSQWRPSAGTTPTGEILLNKTKPTGWQSGVTWTNNYGSIGDIMSYYQSGNTSALIKATNNQATVIQNLTHPCFFNSNYSGQQKTIEWDISSITDAGWLGVFTSSTNWQLLELELS